MKLIEAYSKLLSIGKPIIETSEVATVLDVTPAYASQILNRLHAAKLLKKLMRSKWLFSNSKTDAISISEFITQPHSSYVSLQTALYHHKMISQMSSVIYLVSLARTERVDSEVGTYSIHHVLPEFFFGFESRSTTYGLFPKMATPEKAILDYFYLSQGKTRLFTKLPEIELPKGFSFKCANAMANKILSIRRKTLVLGKLEELKKNG